MIYKIEPSMTYKTFGLNAMGLGFVSMINSKKPYEQTLDGNIIFAHKLMEDTPHENLTDEDRRQIKADCDELVRLLSKFYHEDEYIEE